jgi:hypothetical protein
VTCTATSKSQYVPEGEEKVTGSADYDLRFLNPCTNPAYVNIMKPALPDKTYIIGTGPMSWTHEAFTVDTKPFKHDLCGPLDNTPYYEGNDISSECLSIDPSLCPPLEYPEDEDKKFVLETDDDSLEDEDKEYSVKACFTDWPETCKEKKAQIDFGDKCLAATAEGTDQDNFPDNAYDKDMEWELKKFTSDPVGCKINYRCDTITLNGDEQTRLLCDSLNFDGEFDGDDDDGEINRPIGPEDYTDPETGIPPGTYTIKICGKVEESMVEGAEVCKDVTITFTDPCNPPNSITIPNYED